MVTLTAGTSSAKKDFQLDTSAIYHAKLTLPDKGAVPNIGGGSIFQFTFNNSNRFIGGSGVWRGVQGRSFDYSIIARYISEALFEDVTEELNTRNSPIPLERTTPLF